MLLDSVPYPTSDPAQGKNCEWRGGRKTGGPSHRRQHQVNGCRFSEDLNRLGNQFDLRLPDPGFLKHLQKRFSADITCWVEGMPESRNKSFLPVPLYQCGP